MGIITTSVVVCDRSVPGFEPGDIRTACRNGLENPSAPTYWAARRQAKAMGWRIDGLDGFPQYVICPTCQWRWLPLTPTQEDQPHAR